MTRKSLEKWKNDLWLKILFEAGFRLPVCGLWRVMDGGREG